MFCFLNEWFQGPTEKEQIDVQGDISYDIVDFITETWRDVTYSYHYLSSSMLDIELKVITFFIS